MNRQSVPHPTDGTGDDPFNAGALSAPHRAHRQRLCRLMRCRPGGANTDPRQPTAPALFRTVVCSSPPRPRQNQRASTPHLPANVRRHAQPHAGAEPHSQSQKRMVHTLEHVLKSWFVSVDDDSRWRCFVSTRLQNHHRMLPRGCWPTARDRSGCAEWPGAH